MKTTRSLFLTLVTAGSVLAMVTALAQGPAGSGGTAGARPGQGAGPGAFGAPPRTSLPSAPVAVTLPRFAQVTGPGAVFDSAPAQWPGRDMAHFGYIADEYLVSGTADGTPYTTRVVIRRPADTGRASGLVVAEAMHPVGAAHAFEYNSVYIMDSGHIAVEIATSGAAQIAEFNPARYGTITVGPTQNNDILAQVGALVRSVDGPLAGLPVRKMVLWGTSASSRILTDYLPAHAVYRQPGMQHIYDGFMPTSNGSQIAPVDVPMIQVPTQHEYERIATAQQDGDAPGSQFRVYEFVGMGHLDSRNNRHRLTDGDCMNPLSTYPTEAFMSVALHHLLRWVDTGAAPPRAERVLLDRNVDNDGSLMVLDMHGNPVGGIRNPYVDVPVATYTARNTSSRPAPSPQAGGGFDMTALLCSLSAYQTAFPRETLRALYGSKRQYVERVRASLDALEAQGWSLPVYRDVIVADAQAVEF